MTNKVGLIADLHLGIQEHNQDFINNQLKSLKYHFSEFKKRGIKRIFILGDLFNNRKYITFNCLFKQFSEFLEIIKDFELTIICGNHDAYYKTSNKINSISLLLSKLDNVTIIDEYPIEIDGLLFIPWINKANLKKTYEAVKASNSKYVFGHFEFSGFELIRGITCEKSQLDLNLFSKFDHIYTGHFHCPSTKHNITYVGSPFEINWSDFGDQKHSIILDLESGKTEYIKNKIFNFLKIHIDSKDFEIDIKQFKGKNVKIYLNVEITVKLEKLIQSIIDISSVCVVTDNFTLKESFDADEIEVQSIGITEVFEEYLNHLENLTNEDKSNIIKIFTQSYNEVLLEEN